ncbi:hypothetical protein [Actinoplanes sp. NPDC051494]|uniref:hypothetical protein n=1 Tax=Actinoplanes sp. NPDC051494 TaxID=3363907 RepID=UPI0037B4DA23
MAATEPPIPVTGVQWQTVLQDSDVLGFLELVRDALTGIDAAVKGGPRPVGRRLRPVVMDLADAVHGLNVATADVLAFDPPQGVSAQRLVFMLIWSPLRSLSCWKT